MGDQSPNAPMRGHQEVRFKSEGRRTASLGRMSLLVLIAAALSAGCDTQFEIQAYELPDGQGYRHVTAMVDESRNELIMFGGLGNGGPSPPTPMNYHAYWVDLTEDPEDQEWTRVDPADTEVTAPWFTSTDGFLELGGKHYLACDDSNDDAIYEFDPETKTFELLTSSNLAVQFRAGDCCAVGVTVPNARDGNTQGEERIYLVGGRNDFGTVGTMRYYSITYDRWERVADLHQVRSHVGCAAAQVRGQPRVYAIAGGDSATGEVFSSLEVYDVLGNSWTIRENYLSIGRTRMATENLDDKYIIIIGGDRECAGTSTCNPDNPLDRVELIDLRNGDRLLSPEDYPIPQLQIARASPGTALRHVDGTYELYVVAGRSRDSTGTIVLTSTEKATLDERLVNRRIR